MIIFQMVYKLQSGNEYAEKSIIGEIIQKVIKGELSFLYATHRHVLFYITVKYHQNVPNGIQFIELTRKCLRTDGQTTDGRQAHRYIHRTCWSGDKNLVTNQQKAGFLSHHITSYQHANQICYFNLQGLH